jgi:hypothetical protein
MKKCRGVTRLMLSVIRSFVGSGQSFNALLVSGVLCIYGSLVMAGFLDFIDSLHPVGFLGKNDSLFVVGFF